MDIFQIKKVDILEDKMHKIDSGLLDLLLKDQTSKSKIIWATNNYEKLGDEYKFLSQIKPKLVTGKQGKIIKPRSKKSNIEKKLRIKEKAEVFTPSWTCNLQNNIIDEIWFNQKNIFNESTGLSWITNHGKIGFKDKNWIDYINDKRIEIACGEAPYIVSRYDTVTGEKINLQDRIGILDRKIRVINENATNELWFEYIIKAYKSVYGYEWQGDSLLIARENLLYTFIDYYVERYKHAPSIEALKEVAEIISWNFFQMDGLKGVIPMSCEHKKVVRYDLFGEEVTEPCYGCENNNLFKHNGIYVLIKDWDNEKVVRFIDLISRGLNV